MTARILAAALAGALIAWAGTVLPAAVHEARNAPATALAMGWDRP